MDFVITVTYCGRITPTMKAFVRFAAIVTFVDNLHF